MKNPYALGFWCAVVALVLLTATYFYGIMLALQIDTALTFLDSAALLSAVMSSRWWPGPRSRGNESRKDSLNKARPW